MNLRFGMVAAFVLILTNGCAKSPEPSAPTKPPAATAQSAPPPPTKPTPSLGEIVAASRPDEWRRLDPENTLYIDFPKGRVVIELAPTFAPNHVANVKALAREGYFTGGAVTRVQDNYVAQWAQAATPPRPPKVGKDKLKGEFTRPRDPRVPFTPLPDPDTYAPEVGFSDGFAVGRDDGAMWLAHCYGVVGVGRDNDEDSGSGEELYAVIGESPRGLDRNITVLGRIIQGAELLSALPRGTEALGFYKSPKDYRLFSDIKVAADLPATQRTSVEVLRTDSASFAALVNARRSRNDAFYHRPSGRLGLCNVPIPTRPAVEPAPPPRP